MTLNCGNSEKRAKFDALPTLEVSSAAVRGIEHGEGFVQRVFKWLESINAFGVYINDTTGWDNIAFNRRSVKSVIHHAGRDGKIALLGIIPQLISSGIYLETNPTNKEGVTSHIFANKAAIDGETYAVTYVVREDRIGMRYYDHSLIRIKALDRINGQAPAPTNEIFQGLRMDRCLPAVENASVKPLLNNILKKHLAVKTQN